MRILLALAMLSLSCTKEPESWPITEADEYAVYQALLDLDRMSALVGATIDSQTSVVDFMGIGPNELEGFDLIAFDAFRRANATSRKIDPTRLRRKPNEHSSSYSFSRVGFDSRGMHAVVTASNGVSGNIFALVRTVDGRWAVTRSRMLWIS
jgi:hypothetical protein